MRCYWKITSKSRIRLSFEAFDTEKCCDKVTIYDGGSGSSRRLGEYSGSSIPRPFLSSSNALYVTFNTDRSGTRTGFSAKYQSI